MPSAVTQTRLLLVDDHTLFREGLVRLLGADASFQVVGQCAGLEEALQLAASGSPDVILLDFDLGSQKAPEFLRRARQMGLHGHVLIITAGVSDAETRDLLAQGAAGIFLKHNSPELLAKCIRKVREGEIWLDQRHLRIAVQPAAKAADGPKRLSDREREVMRGLLEGLANKEIGARMQLSESAVKAVLQQLFQKAGVRTRSQLVRVALEQYMDQL